MYSIQGGSTRKNRQPGTDLREQDWPFHSASDDLSLFKPASAYNGTNGWTLTLAFWFLIPEVGFRFPLLGFRLFL
jgi:hypothetical protein